MSSSKTANGTETHFLHNVGNDNLHLNRPLVFLLECILIDILHFPCLCLSDPQKMGKFISVVHHINQKPIYPQLMSFLVVYLNPKS